MSREQKQAVLRKLVEAREVKARKLEVLRNKKCAEERGKRYDEHHDQEYGPDEVVCFPVYPSSASSLVSF